MLSTCQSMREVIPFSGSPEALRDARQERSSMYSVLEILDACGGQKHKVAKAEAVSPRDLHVITQPVSTVFTHVF